MIHKYLLLLLLSIGILSATGCGADDDYIPMKQQAKQQQQAPLQKYKYSIYIENSESLNGYLSTSGSNDFKSNVYNFITTISSLSEKESLSLYDINIRIIPAAINADAKQVGNYITHLDSTTFKVRSKAKGGNQKQSDLGTIFSKILDTTGIDEISILISDCIFSPGKNGNASTYLDQQENRIQLCIDEKLNRQPFSTLVLQFYSQFKGNYFDQNDSPKRGTFEHRPYYIVCLGKEDALRNLLKCIQQRSDQRGFQNYLFLTDKKTYDVTPVIRAFNDYYEYEPTHPLTVTQVGKNDRDNKFRIKFNVNYSSLPVNESYFKNRDNYAISQGYSIESIKDRNQDKYTHEIVVVSSKAQAGTLKFSLKNKLPEWIEGSSLDEDAGLPAEDLAGKTFGLKYLLRGMYSAFYNHNGHPDYFTFYISVKD